jgi:hypothetical protein
VKKLICVFAMGLLASMAQAEPAVEGCEARAIDKNGKALSGAAKASFLKKCNAEGAESCGALAVSRDGKPLFGAAKDASIKKCQDDSGITSACEEKAVSKAGKALSGAAKDKFMQKCLREAV